MYYSIFFQNFFLSLHGSSWFPEQKKVLFLADLGVIWIPLGATDGLEHQWLVSFGIDEVYASVFGTSEHFEAIPSSESLS